MPIAGHAAPGPELNINEATRVQAGIHRRCRTLINSSGVVPCSFPPDCHVLLLVFEVFFGRDQPLS
jgi:hypothetical protein